MWEEYTYNNIPFKYLSSDFIRRVKSLPVISFYRVQVGDRLESISYKVYGSFYFWYAIAIFNNKKHALDLEVGELLQIPSYEHLKQII